MRIILAFLVMALSFPAFAAKPNHTDHPLLSAYEGSTIYSKDMKEYDEYKVFRGWDKETKEYNTEMLEGKVTKILYKNPKERSILELYRNYEAALATKGVEIIYSCNQANMECVNDYIGANLRNKFNISAIGNKAGRYVYAKLEQEDQIAYLILAVGEAYTDVHIIEMKKMETGKAAVNLQVLAEGIDKQGFVVVEGIYFDTDKATLKPESSAAIEEVAKLLAARADLSLYVVGHTDMQGDLQHNMNLSKDRAQSVVNELVSKHGVSAARLDGHGVGPLSPQASNASDSGRSLNRRVVLVAR
ncbi:MAG: hypothetical protein COV36_00635 [Alphaproteobacteria bacterium CG11_big_fil_rev_8_21_14_0_20_44_7]|nr:MAG: hypothetical protein COV36_00635 [Alphaproteobacteria bacterium CG11_big_fil_rev_8_21_14_0_20_44_7]